MTPPRRGGRSQQDTFLLDRLRKRRRKRVKNRRKRLGKLVSGVLVGTALFLVVSTATLTLVGLAAIYRPLVVECFNPGFLAAMGVRGSVYHYLFLALAVLNMVAGFQALGTLMAPGIILLPAVAASFWAREVWSMTLIAAPMAFASAAIGLLVSFHAGLPSGPVIVLFASLFFLGSLLLGSRASVRMRLSRPVHLRG